MIRFGAGHVVKAAVPPASCLWCDEGFDEAGGVLLNDGRCPFHTDCLQRMVVGGVNHQRQICTCCGGSVPPDPPSLSRREAARVAAMHFRLHCPEGAPWLA